MVSLIKMLRRSLVLVLAIAIFMLSAAATAFINSSYQDSRGMVSFVELKSIPQGRSAAEVLATMDQLAKENRVNFYLDRVSENGQEYFAFIGDPDTALIKGIGAAGAGNTTSGDTAPGKAGDAAGNSGEVFRQFNPDRNVRIKPHTEIDTSRGSAAVLGLYQSNAPAIVAAAMRAALQEEGFDTAYEYRGGEDPVGRVRFTLIVDTGGVVIVGLFILLAAAVYHTARRYRECVIQTVCGRPVQQVLGAEYLTITLYYFLAIAGTTLIGLPLLYAYNGFAQSAGFFGFLALLYLIGLLVLLGGQTLGLLLFRQVKAFEILRGYKPLGAVVMMMLILQAVVFGTTAVATGFGGQSVSILQEENSQMSRWSGIGDYQHLRQVAMSATRVSVAELASFAADQDQAGKMLLAANDVRVLAWIQDIAAGADPDAGSPPATPSYNEDLKNQALVISSLYLQHQNVLGADGQRILPNSLPARPGQVYALVQEGYPYPDEAILKAAKKWAHYANRDFLYDRYVQAGKTEEEASKLLNAEPDNSGAALIKLAADQELFNYRMPRTDRRINEPVHSARLLFLIPHGSELGGLTQYEHFARVDGFFFADPQAVSAYFASSRIGDGYTVESVAQRVQSHYQERVTKLRTQLLMLAVSALMLFLSGAILARIYCEAHARQHFVQLVSGYSFLRMHRRYLLLNAAGLLAFILLTAGIVFSMSPDGSSFAYPAALVLMLCMGYFGFLLWSLRVNQRQLQVKTLSAGY